MERLLLHTSRLFPLGIRFAQAIVHPQSFVVVSKIDGPVTFVERPADSLPLADPLTNEGGFRIVPPFSQRYQVYFLINDVIYAHSEFTWRRPIPRPKPQPVFDVAIEAEGGVNEAVVHVELSTQEGLINKIEWGEPVINGHSVKANVAINFTP